MSRAAVGLLVLAACGQDAPPAADVAAQAEAARRAAAVRAVPNGAGVAPATGHTLDVAIVLRDVLAPQPGLGPVFAGVQLGAPGSGFLSEPARTRIEAFKAATGATVYFDFAAQLDRITVSGALGDAAAGERLIDELTARWGRPLTLGPTDVVWRDEATSTRLRVTTTDEAQVTIAAEPYSTARRLIAPANPDRFGFEPQALLGRPLGEVLPVLPAATRTARAYTWYLPPMADGRRPLEPALVVDADDRVIRIALPIVPGDCADVVAQVTAKLGAAAQRFEDAGVPITRWKARDRVVDVSCNDDLVIVVAELR